MQFPYLEVTGTHEDLGRAIGTRFAKQIQQRIEHRRKTLPNYSDLLGQTKPYFAAAQHTFPHLVDELVAMASGAKVPIEDLFLLNNHEVYNDEIAWAAQQSERCTIAVGFNENGVIVGHNEDIAKGEIDNIYILKATINGVTFMGLQYCLELPGTCVTLNSWGLVQCINTLFSKTVIGVPKHFVSRAILACKSLDEAQNLITTTNRASGFNHVLVQNDEVRNIEIAGREFNIEKMTRTPFAHTNHFLSQELLKFQTMGTQNSHARFARAQELLKETMSVEDMKLLLSDTKDPDFPICIDEVTHGAAVVVPKDRMMYICYGPPCKGEFTPYYLHSSDKN